MKRFHCVILLFYIYDSVKLYKALCCMLWLGVVLGMGKKSEVGIRISREAWEALKKQGRYGDTFSDIILRLVKSQKRRSKRRKEKVEG